MEGGLSWYFAYGSNMNALRLFEERLKPQGVGAGDRIAGRLDGWRLAFNKQGRVPGTGAGNIVLAAGEVVHGTLNLLPAKGFEVLDQYEGVAGGHYERRCVPVVRGDTGEAVEAITYVAMLVGAELRPTRVYLAHLLAGRDLLPEDYCRWLGETPTID
jgi:gamma-glutamylcyclotransferase